MKIVVDINHPAHVHYFKNFIWEMERRGHQVLITASEKDISYRLLDLCGFNYTRIGNYGRSILEKLINIPRLDLRITPSEVQTGDLRGVRVDPGSARRRLLRDRIALDDSEPSPSNNILYVPCRRDPHPTSFRKDFGDSHQKYEGISNWRTFTRRISPRSLDTSRAR